MKPNYSKIFSPVAAVFFVVLSVTALAETSAERDARMAWWREARFGMFVHWGVFAVPAGAWNGKPVAGHSEWLMNQAAVPVDDYAKLAERFNPTKFDAEAWVTLAKNTGMKYLVITTKHHDGFAMFHTRVDGFNIFDATPWHRDPLKELANACRRQGIKLGVYYSQAQDWHHRGGRGNFWDPSQQGDFDQYLDAVAVPQVKELLSNYGPIAVLWYDTPRNMTPERAEKFLPLHALQPGLIVNNRLRISDVQTGGTIGDTETPEQFIPANGYPGKDWETCMTMNDSWGFKQGDTNWKSADDLIRKLSDIASKGGNFLLNVGPDAQGEIPAASRERLQTVGAWLQRNGVAIYGTQASPFQRRLPWGRVTQKTQAGGVTLFLHVWDWPANRRLLLPGVHQLPRAGKLLVGGAAVTAEDAPEGIVVKLPAQPPDAPVAIVALEFAQSVTTTQTLPAVAADGRILLTASDCEITNGKMSTNGDVSVESRWNLEYLFTTPVEKYWTIKVEVASMAYNRIVAAVPGPFGFSVASALQAWGRGPDDFVTIELGTVHLPAGVNALELKSEMNDLRPLKIRRLWLAPPK